METASRQEQNTTQSKRGAESMLFKHLIFLYTLKTKLQFLS
jgi:hypothetical protein